MDARSIKRKEREKYDAIAEAFYANWREFNGRISQDLVDIMDAHRGEEALDLAAGWGEAGFLLAQRVGDTGKVTITDISPGILEIAKRNAAQRGLANVAIRVMDAEELDFPDAAFDIIVCAFGIMYMPNEYHALSEAQRVLRPGGRIGFAVWSVPERVPLITLPTVAYMNNAAPLPIRLLLRTPGIGSALRKRVLSSRSPVGPSPMRFGAPKTLDRAMNKAGFVELRRETRTYPLEFPSFATFIETFDTSMPGVPELLEEIPAARKAAIQAELRTQLTGATSDRVHMDNEVVFVTGKKRQ